MNISLDRKKSIINKLKKIRKSPKELAKYVEELNQERLLYDKTIHFWHLQLQFMSMSELRLLNMLDGTKHYQKLNTLRYNGAWESYQMELATEVALQLSGIEE